MSTQERAHGVSVIKIGGSLARVPAVLDRVCAVVARCSSEQPIVVVPGGGPLADVVRELDAQLGLSASSAHWMAILAMDQFAQVLAERIKESILVEEPGAIGEALCQGKVAVLAPSRWMRSADVLPHTWDVTSDTIAAFVAGALDAARLILVKPPTATALLDGRFSSALPTGLPYHILRWSEIDELPAKLRD